MDRLWIALRSVVYATFFLAAWGWAALKSRVLDKQLGAQLPHWLFAPGAVLMVCGAALALTTVAYFIFEGRGTPAVFDAPRKFVPHGPYRLVRNPMYVGGISTLWGLSFCLRSISMLLFALVTLLVVHSFVVLVEEPGLRKRFGQEYEDFCKTVPRWVPRFTRQHLPT